MRIGIVWAILAVYVLSLCMARVCGFATVMIHGTLAVFLVDWITFNRAIARAQLARIAYSFLNTDVVFLAPELILIPTTEEMCFVTI